MTGVFFLLFFGTPSEVRWLSADEKKIAAARILANNAGHDQTGTQEWNWGQVRECLVDPIVRALQTKTLAYIVCLTIAN